MSILTTLRKLKLPESFTGNPTTKRSPAQKWARRISITLLGGTVLAVGIAMIVLPGPAVVVIPIGLAILGLEYAWARNWLQKIKSKAEALAASKSTKPHDRGG